MKTSELTGAALDWAVAKCEGLDYWQPEIGSAQPEYSADWAQGGAIIEREKIGFWYCDTVVGTDGYVIREATWYAENEDTTDTGETPLIAAMRCYVASKLGDEVEVPAELI